MLQDRVRACLENRLPYTMLRASCTPILKMIPDASIDAIVTDPPYGIELKLGTSRTKQSIAGDGKLQAKLLWREVIPELARIAKPDSAHVIFGTWKSPWMHEVLSAHFRVVGAICWNKRIIGLGHFLRPQWEMAYLVVKGKPKRNGTAPSDVWDVARLVKTRHPCEKPVALLRRAVQLVSRPGDLVFDPFAGIGSTGVAAIADGRRFLGIEIASAFYKVAIARLADSALVS